MWYEILLMLSGTKTPASSDNTIIEKRNDLDEYLWMKPFVVLHFTLFANDANKIKIAKNQNKTWNKGDEAQMKRPPSHYRVDKASKSRNVETFVHLKTWKEMLNKTSLSVFA